MTITRTGTDFTVVALGSVLESVVKPILPEGTALIAKPSLEDMHTADAAIVRAAYNLSDEVLAQMPNLKVIARTGVGVERVDVDSATKRGIPVAITPGSGAQAVAEGAFAMILALVKQLPRSDRFVKSGQWQEGRPPTPGDLEGATLAVFGFGRIGRKVAEIGAAFGMRIVVHDPFVESDKFENLDMADALREADVISLHLPGGQGRLIDSEQLRSMKPTSVIVNCARAEFLSFDDLFDALTHGRIGGVGLDVYPDEPASHHPLFDLDNVVLSPHTTGISQKALRRTLEMAADAVAAVLKGRDPLDLVNPEYVQAAGKSQA